jgi:hypothetical protein
VVQHDYFLHRLQLFMIGGRSGNSVDQCYVSSSK